MQRLSSNATLFLKIFLPVFWTTIVLMMNLVLWFSSEHYFGALPLQSLRWGMLLVLVAGSATFWLLFWPLKRVEATADYLYVSNYFKTARYSWQEEVASIKRQRFLFFHITTVELKGVGAFGQRFHFLASRRLMESFSAEHPQLMN